MIYCQDCGAANDVAVTFCRICGRTLSPERGSVLCPSCSQPIVNQATFCSSCGITVMQAPSAQPAHNFAFAGAAAEGGGLPHIAPPLNPAVQVINESLDLPDWLKRAAAEQPQDSTQTTDNNFMYTGVNPSPVQPPVPTPPVQTEVQQSTVIGESSSPEVSPQAPAPWPAQPVSQPVAPEASLWPSQVQPTMSAQVAAPPVQPKPPDSFAPPSQSRKLVPTDIPSGGLDQGMPSWLNQLPQGPAQPDAVAAQPATHAPAPVQTDTTSFISESDLPAWIRQLAEAEEQRKVQEAAAAATATAANYQLAPPAALPPSQDLFGEGSFAHRISLLPGEAEPQAVSSNPWLSRSDQPVITESPQADNWSRPKSETDRRVVSEESVVQQILASADTVQIQATLASDSASPEQVDDNWLRLALLIAAAVSVAALAAYLFMTGSL